MTLALLAPSVYRFRQLSVRFLGILTAVVCTTTGCDSGTRVVSPPTAPPPDADTTSGTVRRGDLTVTVVLDAADGSIATAAGLSADAVAGAAVRVSRDGSPGTPPFTGVSDASGRITFTGLLEGRYAVSAERVLADSTRARLAPDDQDVSVLAGGGSVTVSPGSVSTRIDLVASRRGSIAIHELWVHTPPGYVNATYLSIYNNADTVIYLDGMLLGHTPPVHRTLPSPPNVDRCALFGDAIRLNTDAIGAVTLIQFPGSGQQYPLEPGQGAVIAQDAIDHRQFVSSTVDLSAADFEVIGDDRDVDNPAVPNMIRLVGGLYLGRGWTFNQSQNAVFLALPPDAPLDRRRVGDSYNVAFIPRERLLDVVGIENTPDVIARLAALGMVVSLCNPWMHPLYERDPVRIADLNDNTPHGFARRVAYRLPDGRAVLQRTRTSSRDWQRVEMAKMGRP